MQENKEMAYQTMRREQTLEMGWVVSQHRTFTRWVNRYMERRGITLPGLVKPPVLTSGFFLLLLLEELSGHQFFRTPKQMERAQRDTKFQYIENLNLALDFVKEQGVYVDCGVEDLLDGNLRLTLGFIWKLILHYQFLNCGFSNVEETKTEEESEIRTAPESKLKSELLEWVNSKIGDYGLHIKNFGVDFRDGRVVCALTDALKNGCLDYAQVKDNIDNKDQWLANAALGIDVAFNQLDVPKLIDAEDMVADKPDEISVMTYVSVFKEQEQVLLSAVEETSIEMEVENFPTKGEVTVVEINLDETPEDLVDKLEDLLPEDEIFTEKFPPNVFKFHVVSSDTGKFVQLNNREPFEEVKEIVEAVEGDRRPRVILDKDDFDLNVVNFPKNGVMTPVVLPVDATLQDLKDQLLKQGPISFTDYHFALRDIDGSLIKLEDTDVLLDYPDLKRMLSEGISPFISLFENAPPEFDVQLYDFPSPGQQTAFTCLFDETPLDVMNKLQEKFEGNIEDYKFVLEEKKEGQIHQVTLQEDVVISAHPKVMKQLEEEGSDVALRFVPKKVKDEGQFEVDVLNCPDKGKVTRVKLEEKDTIENLMKKLEDEEEFIGKAKDFKVIIPPDLTAGSLLSKPVRDETVVKEHPYVRRHLENEEVPVLVLSPNSPLSSNNSGTKTRNLRGGDSFFSEPRQVGKRRRGGYYYSQVKFERKGGIRHKKPKQLVIKCLLSNTPFVPGGPIVVKSNVVRRFDELMSSPCLWRVYVRSTLPKTKKDSSVFGAKKAHSHRERNRTVIGNIAAGEADTLEDYCNQVFHWKLPEELLVTDIHPGIRHVLVIVVTIKTKNRKKIPLKFRFPLEEVTMSRSVILLQRAQGKEQKQEAGRIKLLSKQKAPGERPSVLSELLNAAKQEHQASSRGDQHSPRGSGFVLGAAKQGTKRVPTGQLRRSTDA
eukprot:CAMPEP_0174276948 /NCGR_PEP_ID=MMETSP0439-20130205/60667_1 /TAXON_ID=0 /ORGANISM="Stereomyxa ramosa, Strain Chinc5" /LENGTH=938 /DNA_ID=CAMNT_0015369225 /DNA_START=32 /DNA_END=2848 /DNA_ORIENTATION=-